MLPGLTEKENSSSEIVQLFVWIYKTNWRWTFSRYVLTNQNLSNPMLKNKDSKWVLTQGHPINPRLSNLFMAIPGF